MFRRGDYKPLTVRGPERDHIISYTREYGGDAVIIIVGRRFAEATEQGQRWPQHPFDAEVDVSDYRITAGELTGNWLPLAALLRHIPVAIIPARYTPASRENRARSSTHSI